MESLSWKYLLLSLYLLCYLWHLPSAKKRSCKGGFIWSLQACTQPRWNTRQRRKREPRQSSPESAGLRPHLHQRARQCPCMDLSEKWKHSYQTWRLAAPMRNSAPNLWSSETSGPFQQKTVVFWLACDWIHPKDDKMPPDKLGLLAANTAPVACLGLPGSRANCPGRIQHKTNFRKRKGLALMVAAASVDLKSPHGRSQVTTP